jgi:hypothetical protein
MMPKMVENALESKTSLACGNLIMIYQT